MISVGDAFDFDRPAGRLLLVAGGVATSGTIRRSWRTADGEHHHHLLDPMTGRPAQHTRQIVSATVVAGSAAWAEVWTKALAVRGEAVLGTLDGHGLAASMTDDDGAVVTNEAWRSFDCSPAARVA